MQIISDLKDTFRRWSDDNGSLMAAGVAYYGALSFFPLLLTLISGIGLMLQFTVAGQNAEQQLLEAVGNQMSAELQQHIDPLSIKSDPERTWAAPWPDDFAVRCHGDLCQLRFGV